MKKFTHVVDNKMRGSFGETDLNTNTIRINKKMHLSAKKNPKRYGIAKKDNTLLNTIVHERLHAKHPKALEKTIRKKARAHVEKMGPKAKQKAYRFFRYPKKQ